MSKIRFLRNYRLTVTIEGGSGFIIEDLKGGKSNPIKIVFSIDKSVEGGANTLDLEVYNLAEKSREIIAKDPEDDSKQVSVQLEIGYDGKLETIFIGRIFKGFNERSGVDIISKIESQAGVQTLKNAYTIKTFAAGTDINKALAEEMLDDVDKGKITQEKKLTRPKVVIGNPIKMLKEYNNKNLVYIDDGKLFITDPKENAYEVSVVPVISPQTGLISTPTRQSMITTARTQMNASIKLGGYVVLRSTTASYINGVYKVISMTIAGDNYGSDWYQDVTMIPIEGFTVSDVVDRFTRLLGL